MELGQNQASSAESGLVQDLLSRRAPSPRPCSWLLLAPARKRNRSAALAFPCRHEATFARSDTMRSSIIGLAAMAALFALPEIASATDAGAAAGATTGAVAGAVVGGPGGAVAGAGGGRGVGGAASGPTPPGTVIVEEPPPATREQTCIQDSLGNRTCKEVVR